MWPPLLSLEEPVLEPVLDLEIHDSGQLTPD